MRPCMSRKLNRNRPHRAGASSSWMPAEWYCRYWRCWASGVCSAAAATSAPVVPLAASTCALVVLADAAVGVQAVAAGDAVSHAPTPVAGRVPPDATTPAPAPAPTLARSTVRLHQQKRETSYERPTRGEKSVIRTTRTRTRKNLL